MVPDINISGFGGHIAISGCPSVSHLFEDTSFELAVIDDFAFTARITIIEIKIKSNHVFFRQLSP